VSLRTRLLALLITSLVRVICVTLRFRMENEAIVRDLLAEKKGLILVTWHGRVLIPLHVFRGLGYWTIISLSRDGDLQAENFRRAGFHIVRGSTSRRSVAATREVLTVLENGGVFAFVPDGPRGPSQKAQGGVVYFAQRSGRPIIPVGISAWPRWLAPSWDRFLVPWPFARAVWLYGDPIYVGPDDDLDAAVLQVERAINALEAEAERRVAPRKPGEPQEQV
jgi:lysophospholipid acyltransferase (LPLAT)-like uncharacterized protein